MSEPRNHHFIPQNWIRRFCDSDGKIFAVRKSDDVWRGFRSDPKNLFVKKDLYAMTDPDSGELDQTIEKRHYGPVDDILSETLPEVCSVLSDGKIPVFDKDSRLLLLRLIFFEMFKRQPRDLKSKFNRSFIDKLVEEKLATGDFKEDPRRLENFDVIVENSYQHSRTRTSSDALETIYGLGLLFGKLPTQRPFILSDLLRIGLYQEHNPRKIPQWIPISPRFGIASSGRIGKDKIINLNSAQLRGINQIAVRQSKTFASSQKPLLNSLAKAEGFTIQWQ